MHQERDNNFDLNDEQLCASSFMVLVHTNAPAQTVRSADSVLRDAFKLRPQCLALLSWTIGTGCWAPSGLLPRHDFIR
jgi:hypothetical protein